MNGARGLVVLVCAALAGAAGLSSEALLLSFSGLLVARRLFSLPGGVRSKTHSSWNRSLDLKLPPLSADCGDINERSYRDHPVGFTKGRRLIGPAMAEAAVFALHHESEVPAYKRRCHARFRAELGVNVSQYPRKLCRQRAVVAEPSPGRPKRPGMCDRQVAGLPTPFLSRRRGRAARREPSVGGLPCSPGYL